MKFRLVIPLVIACGVWAAFWGNWLALPAFVAAVPYLGWQAWRGRREGTRRW